VSLFYLEVLMSKKTSKPITIQSIPRPIDNMNNGNEPVRVSMREVVDITTAAKRQPGWWLDRFTRMVPYIRLDQGKQDDE
jgi:hypothetical protein